MSENKNGLTQALKEVAIMHKTYFEELKKSGLEDEQAYILTSQFLTCFFEIAFKQFNEKATNDLLKFFN